MLPWIGKSLHFHYSSIWQQAINTPTTIMPFLMVFLIQHTRKINLPAVQIKLDELIRATNGANNTPRNLEEMSEKQLDEIRIKYEFYTKAATRKLRTGEDNVGSLDMGFQDNGVTL